MGQQAPGGLPAAGIRVFIVDDDPLSRTALRSFLDTIAGVSVVGEGSEAAEVAERLAALAPDVVLMDIQMTGTNGLELTRALLREHPDLRVLIVSVFPEDPYAVEALKVGASGYLHKRDVPAQLELALARVAAGETYLAPTVAPGLVRRLVHERRQGAPSPLLTSRELEVLGLLAAGASNKEIAAALKTTSRTVKAHVSRILQKLHVEDRTQAAVYALRLGLVPGSTTFPPSRSRRGNGA